MKKIVEYDSKLNTISFGKFKEKELDLFFSICYKMKNEGVNEVTLSFQELKELSNYSRNDIKRFTKDLDNTYTKLLDLKLDVLISSKVRERFVLFTRYRVDEEKKEMTIQLNQQYNFVLNDIGKFTKFDLMEFANLKSTYAKNMFRLLKQFDSKSSKECWYQVKLDDFKIILGIPKSYQMINIDKRVLLPISEQLKPLFCGLKIEKIKKGVRVESLRFTWKNKKEKKKEDIVDIPPVKTKKSVLGEKDFQKHQEQIYEVIKETLLDPVVEIKKIYRSEYEKLYKEYLEKLGEQHSPYMRRTFELKNKVKYEIVEDIREEYIQTRIYTVEDITEEMLLDKNKKKLKGGAKDQKVKKLLEEMNSQNNLNKKEK